MRRVKARPGKSSTRYTRSGRVETFRYPSKRFVGVVKGIGGVCEGLEEGKTDKENKKKRKNEREKRKKERKKRKKDRQKDR